LTRSTRKTASRATIIFLGIFVLLGIVYIASGADPLGLFTPTQLTLTESPANIRSWWEVYFTNPLTINDPNNLSGSIPEKLIAFINHAQTTIHIASYEFDLTPVVQALVAAHQRGVDVRWITDDEAGLDADTKPEHGQFVMLQQAGIQVLDDGRGALMHDKFWIFDGQLLWTGSDNITISGNFKQNNNVIVVHSPEVASIYERQWVDMWNGNFDAKSPSTVDQQMTTVDSTPIQILFSPEDNAIAHILPYIQSAQTSIRFMAFTFTHDELGAAMLERARAGVSVSGVFETVGSDSQYSEMIPLFCAQVPVRQDGNSQFMHHKVIIIDNEIVVTGSLNFTANADQDNNENVIILRNKDIAALYLQEFNRIWSQGHDPDPKKITCP
jgi:phosphatidylserine/phosphatidylglycerophosphate/cardiolipin synthase-like enzyme